MIADFVAGLLQVNIASAAAIVLVMILRRPVRRLFGARVAYALWLVVPLAVAAGLLPQPTEPSALDPVVLAAASAVSEAVPAALRGDTPTRLLAALWLAGALAALVLMTWRQARYMAALGRLEPAGDGVLRAQHPGAGPAVVGVLRPRIVTPSDFETRFAPAQREVILAHERVHLAGGDVGVNAAVAAAQCLGWFNPLIHFGARALRIDQELACDAAVLARFPKARRLYAELLLQTQLATQPLPLGCHWPAASDHPLNERIVMLKSPLPTSARRLAGATFIATLALGAACTAWAAQPSPPALITAPDWSLRPTGEDVFRVYPPLARAQRQAGRALLTCRVDRAGRLADCAVKADDPAFGEAALQLAASFQMRPLARDGAPTAGGRVRIPILFQPPAE